MKYLLYTMIIGAFVLTACSHDDDKDVDNESPLMTLSNPEEGSTYKAGDLFHMEMHLTYNSALRECRVQIIPDSLFSDDHKSSLLHGGAWEYSGIFALEGTSFTIDEHLEVPDTIDSEPLAHGKYRYVVNCTDQSGNTVTEEVIFYLEE